MRKSLTRYSAVRLFGEVYWKIILLLCKQVAVLFEVAFVYQFLPNMGLDVSCCKYRKHEAKKQADNYHGFDR